LNTFDSADNVISLAGGKYSLTVTELFFRDREGTFGISYMLSPALREEDRLFLSLEAVDDLGNEYLSGGGVYDTDEREDLTRGVLSIQGAVHQDASVANFVLVLLSMHQEERVNFTRAVVR
jgi:hypothetical protein